MRDYNWRIIDRNLEKQEIYESAYEYGRNQIVFESFKCAIDILTKKRIIIKLYIDNVSITDISKYIGLNKKIVQKIIDNAKNEFDFKVLKKIIEECNLVD